MSWLQWPSLQSCHHIVYAGLASIVCHVLGAGQCYTAAIEHFKKEMTWKSYWHGKISLSWKIPWSVSELMYWYLMVRFVCNVDCWINNRAVNRWALYILFLSFQESYRFGEESHLWVKNRSKFWTGLDSNCAAFEVMMPGKIFYVFLFGQNKTTWISLT